MSMRLTPKQLTEIAKKVEELDTLGIEVKVIEVHKHDIYLKKTDAVDGHQIVGISDKTQSHGGNLR